MTAAAATLRRGGGAFSMAGFVIVLTMVPNKGADAYAFGRYGYASSYGAPAGAGRGGVERQDIPRHER